jgi:hypothetical protein
MTTWNRSTESLPPIGHEVLVGVRMRESKSHVHAVARLAESDTLEPYWESSDDMVDGLPADDDSAAEVFWMELPAIPLTR